MSNAHATRKYIVTTSEENIFSINIPSHMTPQQAIRAHSKEDTPDAVEVPTNQPNTLRFECPDGWWAMCQY